MSKFAPLKIEILTDRPEVTVATLTGPVNDEANFTTVQIPSHNRLEIDLKGLTTINSIGLRLFKQWSHSLKNSKIEIIHCPTFFVQQLNMIHDLVPESVSLTSFYVPFYSPDLGEETMVLFTYGIEVQEQPNGISIQAPEIKDSEGEPMLMDIVVARFFHFLCKRTGLPLLDSKK